MTAAVAKKLVPEDSTFYPVDEPMPEGLLHREIAEDLRVLLQRFLDGRRVVARVGANQFVYWVPFHPEVTVAPDVYVLPGVTKDVEIDCWKVWETGIKPSLVVEVVSKSMKKDYDDALRRYDEMGVPEVVVFDHRASRSSARRVRWQVLRRVKGRGLVQALSSNEDRVKLATYDCWLRLVGKGQAQRVRVATGPSGEDLWPTVEEERDGEREARAALETEVERLRKALEQAQKAPKQRGPLGPLGLGQA